LYPIIGHLNEDDSNKNEWAAVTQTNVFYLSVGPISDETCELIYKNICLCDSNPIIFMCKHKNRMQYFMFKKMTLLQLHSEDAVTVHMAHVSVAFLCHVFSEWLSSRDTLPPS
jgi:hypothetical protein